jgi:hypothetical protein
MSNTTAMLILSSYLEGSYMRMLALNQHSQPFCLLPCGLFVRFVTAIREAATVIQILWHFIVTEQYVLDLILVSFGIFQEFAEKSLLTQTVH